MECNSSKLAGSTLYSLIPCSSYCEPSHIDAETSVEIVCFTWLGNFSHEATTRANSGQDGTEAWVRGGVFGMVAFLQEFDCEELAVNSPLGSNPLGSTILSIKDLRWRIPKITTPSNNKFENV